MGTTKGDVADRSAFGTLASLDRREVSRLLGRANRSIRAVRSFYLATAILAAATALAILFVELPGRFVAMGAALALFSAAGWWRIRHQPLAWSVAIALLWTAIVAFEWITRIPLVFLPMGIQLLWIVGCWAMLPSMRGVHRLLRQYSDLWLARHMAGERDTQRSVRA